MGGVSSGQVKMELENWSVRVPARTSEEGLVNAVLVSTLFIRKSRKCEAIYIFVNHFKGCALYKSEFYTFDEF